MSVALSGVVVLCACTTVLLSVLAVAVGVYEAGTGASTDPLEDDPRHREHRRRQRESHRIRSAAGSDRRAASDVVADVAREVRDATEPPADDAGRDHDGVARALLPAACRLRRPARSRDFTRQERRAVVRFQQLVRRYAETGGRFRSDGDRAALRETVHRTARELHRTYRQGDKARPPESGLPGGPAATS